MIRCLLLAVLMALFAPVAFAQSTATPVIPGYLTTSGCPSGQTSCFVPYGPSSPQVTSNLFTKPSSSFTRPSNTTAYSAGNLVANSTTAGSVTPMSWTVGRPTSGGTGWIYKAQVNSSNAALTGDTFVVWLYTTSPTVANGDGGGFSSTTSGFICALTVVMNGTAFSDGVSGNGVPNTSNACMFQLGASQIIYGLLQTQTAYTPGSGDTFSVILDDSEN